MINDTTTSEMTVESLLLKVDNQQKIINELTAENEQLFQQFNHLMVRNNKLLKRLDDMQQIVGDLHIRIEELQLINDNLLKSNDNLKTRTGNATPVNDNLKEVIDSLHRRIDEIKQRQERSTFSFNGSSEAPARTPLLAVVTDKYDVEKIFQRWKNFPGQESKNAPNLRKQIEMLLNLYNNKLLTATELFSKTAINAVTGARYVSRLKKFDLIKYTGARKKGSYQITQKGIELIEKSNYDVPVELANQMPESLVEGKELKFLVTDPDL